MKKKITLLMLAASLMLSLVPNLAFSEATWADRRPAFLDEWPWKPPADYISQQNSPDFTWPRVPRATAYDLIVCADEALTDIKYEKRGITANYYNFPHTFEPGTYWWSVRYHCGEGISEWSPASRFLLVPDAYEFVLPEMGNVVEMIPESHPRLVITRDGLEEFRQIKYTTGKAYYENLKATVARYMASPYPEEPYDVKDSDYRNFSLAIYNKCINGGILYMIDGDKEVGNWVAGLICKVAAWDLNGPSRYSRNDLSFRDILVGLAVGFDYVYDCFTPAQRTAVAESIDKRMRIQERPSDGLTSDVPYEVPDNPFRSHGFSAVSQLLEASVATLGDVPFAKEFLEKYLPIWISIAPEWGWEDGGWANGTGYARWGTVPSSSLQYTLYKMGIVNLGAKAYMKNHWKYNMYFLGNQYGAAFGDESSGVFETNFATYNNYLNKFVGNPYARWQNEKYSMNPNPAFDLYFLSSMTDVPAKAPVDQPRSIIMKDIGWGALHSDLLNAEERISLYFRSSRYGSYNHSHADNNSFTIVAYDRELAADTGYYDAYNSNHYNGYYQTSHAHNTITFDKGTGTQVKFKMEETAHPCNFLTHPDFDLIGGSAYDAYNYEWTSIWGHISENLGKLERFERNIIYIRPDQYLIIDDLKKANGKDSNFEFWLNSKTDLEMYKSKDGARITNEDAALDVRVRYPEVEGKYSNIFSGPDLVAYLPTSEEEKNAPVHDRVWFETVEPKQEVKIMTTMSVHKTEDNAHWVDFTEHDGYMEFNFTDGTRIYANKSHAVMECGEYKTDAAAIVLKKQSVMVVDATTVERNGEIILEADNDISYVYGRGELSLSADNDVKFRIKTDEITKVVNERGREAAPGKMEYGYNWSYKDGYFTAEMYKGFFTLYLNGKNLPGIPVDTGKFSYSIDGNEYSAEMNSYYNHDEELVSSVNLPLEADYYIVDKIEGVAIGKNAKTGDELLLRGRTEANLTSSAPVLKLKTKAEGRTLSFAKDDDFEAVEKKLSVKHEMEGYSKKYGSGTVVMSDMYSERGGIEGLNTLGHSMTWEVEVPEDGSYNLVIKHASWGGEEGFVERLLEINGTSYNAVFAATENYGQTASDFAAGLSEQKVELKKGKNTITMYAKTGNMKLDWLGLLKK